MSVETWNSFCTRDCPGALLNGSKTEPFKVRFREVAMRGPLNVTLDPADVPYAEVPFPCMWDLVEYLSYQRIAVSYQYHASHFTVSFPRLDLESVRRILNNWSSAHTPEMQTA
jgi:hypothetical protein